MKDDYIFNHRTVELQYFLFKYNGPLFIFKVGLLIIIPLFLVLIFSSFMVRNHRSEFTPVNSIEI